MKICEEMIIKANIDTKPNKQVEIDFCDICDCDEVIDTAQRLGYQAEPSQGEGVWWIYKL